MFITRIAPSPSGDMHVGTARTAYFNWLLANASGGKFYLRIDDTNKEKSDPAYTDVILKTMDWLGLDYTGPVLQSERFDIYRRVAERLLLEWKAELEPNGAVKLVSATIPETWHDEVAGEMKLSKGDWMAAQETIILRADGSPTYHFASVVDDVEMGINLVCRGVDHISNTPRQIGIYNALGAPVPKFAHIGLIHHGGKKLSKSDGAASMLYYREKGYDPDAVLNFLLRMGWGPKVDDKTAAVIDRDRAKALFIDGGTLKASSSNMDLGKLESYDRKYKAKKGVWRTGAKLIEGEQ